MTNTANANKFGLITRIVAITLVITPPSGRGLVIPIFFRGFFFFGGHLPQTSGFRSAKEMLVVSFATQPRAFILSDRNIFYIPRGGGRTTAGSNAPGAFLVDLSATFRSECEYGFCISTQRCSLSGTNLLVIVIEGCSLNETGVTKRK